MKRLIPYLLIIVAGVFLAASLLHGGWYTSHDGVYHVLRTEEATKMLKLGEFPFRWAGSLDQGFGIPLFTFVYPGPYYLTAALNLVHVPAPIAVKTVTMIMYLVGGLGIYQLFAKKDRYLALGLALIYLMTPYQFLNIFVRGALGEIVALGLMPWCLVALGNIFTRKIDRLTWYDSLPFAGLLLAHNFLGILFGIFLAGYVLFQPRRKRTAWLSLLLGFGLAAFFLIPMVMERGLLYSFSHLDLTFRFDQHFVYLKQFIYSKWDYWYSVPGPDDGMSFQLGFAQMALVALGSLSIIWQKKRSLADLYLLLAYFGSIFLMLDRSLFIWKWIPILQTVQFPWRFLFMTTLLTPLFGFHFFSRLKSERLKYGLLILVLILGFANIRNYRRPMKFLTTSEYTDLYLLNVGQNTTTFRTEILPKWVTPKERFKSEELLINHGNMVIDSLKFDALHVDLQINNKGGDDVGVMTINRNYFPSWAVSIDHKASFPLGYTPEGMLELRPALGVHTYHVYVKSTGVEQLADWISLASLVVIGGIWWLARLKK
jgi:hypothetical protein